MGLLLLAAALGLIALLAFVLQPSARPTPTVPSPGPASDSLARPSVALLPPLTGFVARGIDPAISHWGVDIAVPEGTAVAAPADGVVVLADGTTGGGRTLVIQHADGLVTVFKHNTRLLVRTGERVRAGRVVALSGNTGEWTDGPHLHYEIWQDGEPVDPKPFLAPW